jgi:putative ABC transport system substrate-binding protein
MAWGHGLGGLSALAAGPGAPREVRLITEPESAAGRQILQALKARHAASLLEADPAARGSATHVSVGPAALRRALEMDLKGPLVSVLTSSQAFRQWVGDRSAVTALYADASPLAQLQLMATIFDSRVTVGVLLSDASAYLERPLRQAASHWGLELLLERIAPSSDVVRSLTRLRGAQVLLAVPDSTLYTPDTLRAILESTYRRGMPVIGFSSATVAAGTLATAYCAVDDVVADLLDLLDGLGPVGSGLPEPRFPSHWRVAVNDSVARSLGVPITDKVLNLGKPTPGRSG